MRTFISVCLLLVTTVLSPGLGAEEPVPFDAYVGRTGSTTVWSAEVGRIQSETAELVVVALVVESCCEEAVQQRRGIRIELIDQTTAHNLYIEQHDIPSVVRAVEGLESEINAGLIQVGKLVPNPGADPDRISSCHGRGEFWFAKPPFDQFMVDYCAAARWAGLSMLIHSAKHRFNFPDRRPADLVRVLAQALATLSA